MDKNNIINLTNCRQPRSYASQSQQDTHHQVDDLGLAIENLIQRLRDSDPIQRIG